MSDMDPTLSAALIAAATALLSSWFTMLATRKAADRARIAALESRVDALTTKHRLLWHYCQRLIVHINTGQPPPAPDWPAELNDLE